MHTTTYVDLSMLAMYPSSSFPPPLGHIARPGVIGVSHAQYFTLTLQYTSYHYQMCGVVWCVSIEECEQCSGMLDPQFAFAQ